MLQCLLNGAKSWLFGKHDPTRVAALLAPGGVGILTARCCDPGAVAGDERLLQALEEARNRRGLDFTVTVETITAAHKSLRALSGALNGPQQRLVEQLMALFQTKGLAMFPVLIIDGKLAFYGGVPTAAMIEEKLADLEQAAALGGDSAATA